MGLVLARKKGQVVVLDDELFIEIDEFLEENRLQIYVYDKVKDTEYAYDLYKNVGNKLEIKWNNKVVYLSISNNKTKGKKQIKLVLDADNSISISRSNKIDYLHYVDNDNEEDFDYSYQDNKPKKDDLLVEKYKTELSWFYN